MTVSESGDFWRYPTPEQAAEAEALRAQPFVTQEYPLLPREPAERFGLSLGYQAEELKPCFNCGATGWCWYRYDPATRIRLRCITCKQLGYVPASFQYAFLGIPTPKRDAIAR